MENGKNKKSNEVLKNYRLSFNKKYYLIFDAKGSDFQCLTVSCFQTNSKMNYLCCNQGNNVLYC